MTPLGWKPRPIVVFIGPSCAAPPTYINSYNTSLRKAQRNGGSFVDWSGKDSSWVSSSAMCGTWVSATSWQAAESNPCV